MEIQDLIGPCHDRYFCCLEDRSDEMMEAGSRKELCFPRMRNQGMPAKFAVEIGTACGMIQYPPAEKRVRRIKR